MFVVCPAMPGKSASLASNRCRMIAGGTLATQWLNGKLQVSDWVVGCLGRWLCSSSGEVDSENGA